MDMKKFLQAVDGASSKKPAEGSNDMKKFLRVVNEGAPVAQQQSPEQIAYNQLRAQIDSYDSLSANAPGQNTYSDVSPEVTANMDKMRAKLAQMAAALKAKGIDAAAEYDAPDASVPAAAPVDLSKYNESSEVGMSRFLSIISEGKGPLNRLTQAESIAMQTAAKKKTITNPVLNVKEDAKPSMIGKYFKAVETEIAEAAERSKDRARQLAERVIERVTPNADGSLPDPSINRLTGKPNPPAAEPAPTNVKPSGSTVDYGGATYNLVGVFGDGIRPRIARGDKIIPAKAYILGDKMYVLLDQGVSEDSDPCWDSHKMVGTKKKGGKTVPNCVPKESVQKKGPAGQLKAKDKVDVKGTVLGSKEKSQKGLRNKLVGGST
jgi:hypothetical protein